MCQWEETAWRHEEYFLLLGGKNAEVEYGH